MGNVRLPLCQHLPFQQKRAGLRWGCHLLHGQSLTRVLVHSLWGGPNIFLHSAVGSLVWPCTAQGRKSGGRRSPRLTESPPWAFFSKTGHSLLGSSALSSGLAYQYIHSSDIWLFALCSRVKHGQPLRLTLSWDYQLTAEWTAKDAKNTVAWL